MIKYWKIIGLVAFSCFVLTACDSGSEPGVEESREKMYSKTEESKAAFVKKVKARLGELETKMDELGKEVENVSVESRAELQEQWKNIKAEKEALEAQLQKLQDSSQSEWKDVRADIKDQWEILKNDLDELQKQIDVK